MQETERASHAAWCSFFIDLRPGKLLHLRSIADAVSYTHLRAHET